MQSSATVDTSTMRWCRCACSRGMRRLRKAASTCTELPARRASPGWMCFDTKARTCERKLRHYVNAAVAEKAWHVHMKQSLPIIRQVRSMRYACKTLC